VPAAGDLAGAVDDAVGAGGAGEIGAMPGGRLAAFGKGDAPGEVRSVAVDAEGQADILVVLVDHQGFADFKRHDDAGAAILAHVASRRHNGPLRLGAGVERRLAVPVVTAGAGRPRRVEHVGDPVDDDRAVEAAGEGAERHGFHRLTPYPG